MDNNINKSGVKRLIRPSRHIYYNGTTRGVLTDLQREINRNKELPTDTLIRREVYNIIKTMLENGKGKLEILNCLNQKYPDCSVASHFEQYINDQAKKIKVKSMEEDGEER